jgi:hypothetical protein
MPADSPVQLTALLASGRPEDVLGTPESEWLDFKSTAYEVSTPRGKFEFAKDVAAFANAVGGLIVCGFRAKKKPNEFREIADQAVPVDQRQVNIDSYKSIVHEYVRPLTKITCTWFDHPGTDPQQPTGYLVIEVPALPERDRWAIVNRALNENGAPVTNGWTVPIRSDDTTAFLPADTVYGLMNDGLRARQSSPTPAPQPPTDPVEDRRTLQAALNAAETPMLFFQSTPDRPQDLLPGMYEPGGVRDALRNQDTLRGTSAFNFASIHSPEAHAGGLLLAQPPRMGLLVVRHGAVTAAAAATTEMLGWATQNYSSSQNRISVYVLTELTLEYFRLVDRHVLPHNEDPWTHRVVAADFARDPARTLAPGDDPDFPFRGSPQPATSDDWNMTWTATRDPERDAYEALRRLYPLFGLDVATNPFIENDKLSTTKLLSDKT